MYKTSTLNSNGKEYQQKRKASGWETSFGKTILGCPHRNLAAFAPGVYFKVGILSAFGLNK